jgi:putative hydrolase of the HAD superfamily
MTEAIIFDFFGVICPDLHEVWTRKHHIKNTSALYEEIGKNVDLGLAPEDDYIRSLSIKTGIPSGLIRKELDEEIVINKEIINIIRELRKKYKIGLLSDASASLLDRVLKENHIREYFDSLAVSSEIGYTKPDPENYWFILNTLRVKPEKAVFIDDSPSNVRGAENIGMKAFLYKDEASLRKQLAAFL